MFAELGRASKGGKADYSGITYARISAQDGLFWPCTSPLDGGTPRLFTVVVLREPVSRLYSAYVHGKQMMVRNQINPRDTSKMRQSESTRQRMTRWRHF